MTADHEKAKAQRPQDVPGKTFTVNDPNLFFSTEAASQISKQQGHTEDQAKQLAKAVRAAIFAGELGIYDRRTGLLIEPPLRETDLLFVRLADVYDWLQSPSYKSRLRSTTVKVASTGSAKVERATARAISRTKETLELERAVHAAMTTVWNDWQVNKARDSTLKEPTKAAMYEPALNKLKDNGIRGKRKKPNLSMVRDAAKSWQKPASMKVQISPALAPPRRRSFKGDK